MGEEAVKRGEQKRVRMNDRRKEEMKKIGKTVVSVSIDKIMSG